MFRGDSDRWGNKEAIAANLPREGPIGLRDSFAHCRLSQASSFLWGQGSTDRLESRDNRVELVKRV